MYERLRTDILGGVLAPGERLKFPALGERYGCSVGVAREALAQLTSEGFVITQPRYGYQVRPLSPTDLLELTDARIEIETTVLRRSVDEGDMAWEASLVAAHHVLERVPFRTDDEPTRVTEQWSAAHAAFHLALLAGCRNARLLAMAEQLRGEAELYRRWSVSLGDEPDRDLAAEHRAMMEAAIAHDAELAAGLLGEHISHTARLLVGRTAGSGSHDVVDTALAGPAPGT
ncbi:MAG: FCD domain-containing protein [Pseudonocardia sp.]|nr:FCD domain-containing protein [Pseudonocardia sp.]